MQNRRGHAFADFLSITFIRMNLAVGLSLESRPWGEASGEPHARWPVY